MFSGFCSLIFSFQGLYLVCLGEREAPLRTGVWGDAPIGGLMNLIEFAKSYQAYAAFVGYRCAAFSPCSTPGTPLHARCGGRWRSVHLHRLQSGQFPPTSAKITDFPSSCCTQASTERACEFLTQNAACLTPGLPWGSSPVFKARLMSLVCSLYSLCPAEASRVLGTASACTPSASLCTETPFPGRWVTGSRKNTPGCGLVIFPRCAHDKNVFT